MKRILTKTLIAETLEIMHILDSTTEFADCLLWTGAVSQAGYPIFKPNGCGCTLVRRRMFELTGGTLVPRQPIVTKCNEKLCIHPAHLVQGTAQSVAIAAAKRGAFSTKARCAKIAAAKRSTGKLTMEIAREIRLSDESGPVLAARHGVNKSLINGIKNGTCWKDYSSPFAGLIR